MRAKDLNHIPESDVGTDDSRYDSVNGVSGEENDGKLTII